MLSCKSEPVALLLVLMALNCCRYPYISHLICNAGCGTFNGIDWLKAVRQVLSRPVAGVTVTEYKRQFCGRTTEDGFGFVWQCNVFSHYILVCFLQDYVYWLSLICVIAHQPVPTITIIAHFVSQEILRASAYAVDVLLGSLSLGI